MIVKIFLFILPLALVSKELVWNSVTRDNVSKDTYDKAIKVYVDKKYPQQAKAYRGVLFKKIEKEKQEEIRNSTVSTNNLMWQDNKDARIVKRSWYSAKRYCKDLRLFGFDDWYLPTIKQLKSIINKHQRPAIDSRFKNIISGYYWSSTQSRSYAKDAWRIDFRNGSYSHYYKLNNYYVRCVREEK